MRTIFKKVYLLWYCIIHCSCFRIILLAQCFICVPPENVGKPLCCTLTALFTPALIGVNFHCAAEKGPAWKGLKYCSLEPKGGVVFATILLEKPQFGNIERCSYGIKYFFLRMNPNIYSYRYLFNTKHSKVAASKMVID